MKRNLYILTGDVQTGKTTYLENLINATTKSVSGVIAPAVFENGKKIGIDNVLLPGNERLHLAVKKSDNVGFSKKWKFDYDVLDRVNSHFKNLVLTDLLVVDELGPLELIENKGLTYAVNKLTNLEYKTAIVVIRSHLVGIAQEKFGEAQVIDTNYKLS